ncbi:hypothetical protein C8J56DRAFT_879874 [Mycena floridula]|nr:hypothetical protein C8J56DRAFT_879874 [Mycena floridula]
MLFWAGQVIGHFSPWTLLGAMLIMIMLKVLKSLVMPVNPSPDGHFFAVAFMLPYLVLKILGVTLILVEWPGSSEYDLDAIVQKTLQKIHPERDSLKPFRSRISSFHL